MIFSFAKYTSIIENNTVEKIKCKFTDIVCQNEFLFSL